MGALSHVGRVLDSQHSLAGAHSVVVGSRAGRSLEHQPLLDLPRPLVLLLDRTSAQLDLSRLLHARLPPPAPQPACALRLAASRDRDRGLRDPARSRRRAALVAGDPLDESRHHRLRAHDAAKVWQWLSEHEDQIEMVLMPRRAPELNVDEYLNNDLKGNIHAKGLPNSQKELRQRIQGFLRHLLNWPAHIRNYFLHPDAQYASGV